MTSVTASYYPPCYISELQSSANANEGVGIRLASLEYAGGINDDILYRLHNDFPYRTSITTGYQLIVPAGLLGRRRKYK